MNIILLTVTIIHGNKNSELIANNTSLRNQFWNGIPKPSRTAKNIILTRMDFPFIFLIAPLTNKRRNAKPKPTAIKISKKYFTFSFKMNAFPIITSTVANAANKNTNFFCTMIPLIVEHLVE